MTIGGAYTTSYALSLCANGAPSMGNMVIFKGGAKSNWGTKVSAYVTIIVEQGNTSNSYSDIDREIIHS